MGRKEGSPNHSGNIVPLGIDHGYFGPWVPVSKVPDKKSLGGALEEHILDINGTLSVPVRVVNSLRNPK